jgi:IS605 OrfB family transposase
MPYAPSLAVPGPTFVRTLRLKVKSEAYPWLNAAALEVNDVWNYSNAVSARAARPFAGPPKWLKRLHRRAARRRKDALHKFSRRIVDSYRTIYIGDVSSRKLANTPMAKSVLDAGWGLLKAQLQYKCEHAGRSVFIVSEKNTTRACSSCRRCQKYPARGEVVAVRARERAPAVCCATEPRIVPMRGTDQRTDGGGMNTGRLLWWRAQAPYAGAT